MTSKTIKLLASAAVLLVALGFSSCEREDVNLGGAVIPAKESAILKHIASHGKERTRAGEEISLEEEMNECNTYTPATIAY